MCGVSCTQASQTIVVQPGTGITIDVNLFNYPKEKVFDENTMKQIRDKIETATKDVLASKKVLLPKIQIGTYVTLKLISQSDSKVTSISIDSQGNDVYNTKIMGTNLSIDEIGIYAKPANYRNTGIIIGLFLAELCSTEKFNNDRFYRYLQSIIVDLENQSQQDIKKNILTGLYIFLREYQGLTRRSHTVDAARSWIFKSASVGANVTTILSHYAPKP